MVYLIRYFDNSEQWLGEDRIILTSIRDTLDYVDQLISTVQIVQIFACGQAIYITLA